MEKFVFLSQNLIKGGNSCKFEEIELLLRESINFHLENKL